MARMVGGIVAGLIVAMLVILAVEGTAHRLFPPLTSPSDAPGSLVLDSVPLAAKLSILLGWFLSALAGGWIADRIGRRGLAGYIVAALIVAGGVWTMVEIAHPLWMQIGGVLLPFLGAFLAERLAHRRY